MTGLNWKGGDVADNKESSWDEVCCLLVLACLQAQTVSLDLGIGSGEHMSCLAL